MARDPCGAWNPLPTGGAMQPGGTQPAAPWGMATATRPGTVPFGLLHVKPLQSEQSM